MKSVDKQQLVNTLEAAVNSHLQQALAFKELDNEVLLRPSATGGWSIAQCLEHLNRYGNYYLPAIKQQLQKSKGGSSSNTFTPSWLGNYFTKMMEPATGTKKIKAFKAYIPPAGLDAQVVIVKFTGQQQTLLNLLQQSRQADLNKVKIPISISKILRLRLGDVLRFVVAHDERHLQQAARNV